MEDDAEQPLLPHSLPEGAVGGWDQKRRLRSLDEKGGTSESQACVWPGNVAPPCETFWWTGYGERAL